MKVLKDNLKKCECKEEDLTEGLVDKIKQIIKGKKSDTQAIQDISDIIEASYSSSESKLEKQGQKIKVNEDIEDEEISYIVIFGDDPENFDEVNYPSEVFNTEEEAIKYVKKELPLSDYKYALVDESDPSGDGKTFTMNPNGSVEDVTNDYYKYEGEDIPEYWFSIYELDENGNEIDQLDSYPTEEEAKEFADSLDVPAHVVLIVEEEWDEAEVEEITGYYPYQAIYYNKKAKEMELDESLKEDVKKLPDGKYANVGKDGKADSGKFKTKKEADAQRKAMYANGYKGESLQECDKFKYDDAPYDYDEYHEYEEEKIDYDDDPTMNY